MNNKKQTLYAWQASPYSAKVRAYFKYRNIQYVEKTPSLLTLQFKIQRKVQQKIIPVVQTSSGEWLQDSQDIIQYFDRAYPDQPIYSKDPLTNVISHLLELYADEWMILSAMHFRWQTSGNYEFITADFGRCAAPFLPSFLQKKLGGVVAKQMQAHLRRLGLQGEMKAAVYNWTNDYLADLNDVLAEQPYLLGNVPTMADFAVYGSAYAHLYRDPGSQPVITQHKYLTEWIERLRRGEHEEGAPQYSIHSGIAKILSYQFRDQIPVLQQDEQRLEEWAKNKTSGTKLPAQLGVRNFSIADTQGQSLSRTFSLWRWQNVKQAVEQCSPQEQKALEAEFAKYQLDFSLLKKGKQLVKIRRKNYQLILA